MTGWATGARGRVLVRRRAGRLRARRQIAHDEGTVVELNAWRVGNRAAVVGHGGSRSRARRGGASEPSGVIEKSSAGTDDRSGRSSAGRASRSPGTTGCRRPSSRTRASGGRASAERSRRGPERGDERLEPVTVASSGDGSCRPDASDVTEPAGSGIGVRREPSSWFRCRHVREAPDAVGPGTVPRPRVVELPNRAEWSRSDGRRRRRLRHARRRRRSRRAWARVRGGRSGPSRNRSAPDRLSCPKTVGSACETGRRGEVTGRRTFGCR